MTDNKQRYLIEFQEEPSGDDEQVLFEGINAEAVRIKQLDPIKAFAFFIKDPQGKVLGGANGVTYYGCLYVDMLWLDKELRHQGYGKQLMAEAEKIGRQRNCSFATVNTMDWEALPFYQKLGYQIEFVREGFAKNSKMYFLRKML